MAIPDTTGLGPKAKFQVREFTHVARFIHSHFWDGRNHLQYECMTLEICTDIRVGQANIELDYCLAPERGGNDQGTLVLVGDADSVLRQFRAWMGY